MYIAMFIMFGFGFAAGYAMADENRKSEVTKLLLEHRESLFKYRKELDEIREISDRIEDGKNRLVELIAQELETKKSPEHNPEDLSINNKP
jgi:hypothetical protein